VSSGPVSSHGRANPVSLGLGVSPSDRSNHPTTQRKELNTDITFPDRDGDVQNGPFNVLLHLDVELELARRLSAIVIIHQHQDVVASPVKHGPGIAIALTARLGG